MKTYPVNTKGSTFSIAHLYDIELARLTLTASAVSGATVLFVDDADLCWLGTDNTDSMNLAYSDGSTIKIAIVKSINKYLNQITLYSGIEFDISKNEMLVETLYTTAELPKIDGTNDFIEFYHACYGTLTGKVHLTDYDQPIVVKVDRDVYSRTTANVNGFITYLPFPITYKDVAIESRGKMTSVELTLSNVNQLIGSMILRMAGLKRREITVKTIFFDTDCKQYHICVPRVDTGITTYVSRTTSYAPVYSLNDNWNMFIYAPADNIVTEFSGDIDNTSFTSEQAILTATVKIDNTEAIQIPRRIYSRLKCPFNYKGSQCRFVSQMTLHANIDDAVLSIEVDSPFAYFDEMISGETHIIMIDNEEFEVTAVAVNPITYSQEMQRYRVRQGYPPAASTLQLTVTRAYGGTTAAAHTAGAVVDIVLCRKTEHDCRLHWNMLYFGAFPAIPKNKTTYS